jgi:hypothetical protein
MKRIGILAVLLGFSFALVPTMHAQDLNHVEVGVFAEMFRLHEADTNFGGLGARLAVNPSKYLGLEAEMSYDFNRGVNETFRNGNTTTIRRSDFRVLHGLFGPKIQMGGPVKLFATVKGGFINFGFNPGPGNFSNFTGAFDNFASDNTHFALYPGGGAEAFLGPIGLRVDVGDEIFFANGARHNLRITFGPTFRF